MHNKKMKIVLLVALFPPKWIAGTEIASYNIARHLARRGHEVHVITSLDKGLPENEIKDNFYIHRIVFKKIRIVGFIDFWLREFQKIKKINPNIVHIQATTMAIHGLLLKLFLKKPYVVWAQGSDVYLPDKLTKLISKIVLNNASIVISLSKDMKIKMSKFCKKSEIIILPNGIEVEKFKNLNLNNNSNKKTIIFIGTLRPIKGVKYLIQAMSIINKKMPDTNLLIVGDGPDRDKLETLVQELSLQRCTHFAGKVSNEKIPEYMSQADLFVLPSLSESFGIVNIEAMASGLPIVATNVGGLPEIIKCGENGFVVEPKNPEAIAEKVVLILKDDNLRKQMSENNQKKAKDYSWDDVIKNLISIYESVV